MKIKKTALIALVSVLIAGCSFFPGTRTVEVVLNPENSGWYFIEIVKDTAIKDSGTVKIPFNDTTRMLSVRINDLDKTIVSPFDEKGNSISSRLQYFGIKDPNGKHSFFEFYNPTDEELLDIDKWNPTNSRADKIEQNEQVAFEKYYSAFEKK